MTLPLQWCCAQAVVKFKCQSIKGKVSPDLGRSEKDNDLTYTIFHRAIFLNIEIFNGITRNRLISSVLKIGRRKAE